jgi:hypothetical protein
MGQSASAEIQAVANDLIINVNEILKVKWNIKTVLANDNTKMLAILEPPLSPECCIYRVPSDLRKLNDRHYSIWELPLSSANVVIELKG